jgi:phospholipid transport system substrate-binding protein
MTRGGVVHSVRSVFFGFLTIIGALVAGTGQLSPAAYAADDPAVQFVQRMARELIAANRTGSDVVFADTLKRNANISAIGTYALGSYHGQLNQASRESYLSGMVRFISRYAATESKKYQVSHLQVMGPAQRVNAGIVVDTKVFLRDGQSYDVQWLLQQTGSGYRVRDAKVQVLLGEYWMTPFLKDLFEKYIAENGSVNALVMALNR